MEEDIAEIVDDQELKKEDEPAEEKDTSAAQDKRDTTAGDKDVKAV